MEIRLCLLLKKICLFSSRDVQVVLMSLRELMVGSAGYGIWSAEKVALKPWDREFVLIDLKIAIPEGYYGRVVGRSGIAKKYCIMVHNGTIDSDYRGNVGVILFNLSNEEYVIERGDRIAQLIIERCYSPKFVEVSQFTKDKTERREGRVGSVLQMFDFSS